MSISAILSFTAASFGLMVAAAVLLRDRRSLVHRLFAAGGLLFAAEELARGLSYQAVLPEDVLSWQKWIAAISSVLPAVWLGFSLSYARVDTRALLTKWKWMLLAALVLPISFVALFRDSLFTGSVYRQNFDRWTLSLGWGGRTLEIFFLLASILILFNLERTIRSSVGRMRWQIKFMALGVGGLFALRLYVASQSLLFASRDTGMGAINSTALLAANLLFAISLYRGRSLDVDVYLSAATLRNSLTLILAGAYLLVVGVLARLVRYTVSDRSLPLDALLIFLGLTALAVLLFSNRLRRELRLFVGRHFSRPIYDYRRVWMDLSQRTTLLLRADELSTAVSRMVSESLEILSVSVWLVDDSQQKLTLAGSTAFSGVRAREIEKAGKSAPEFLQLLRRHSGFVDLDFHDAQWPLEIMQAGREFFREASREYKMRYAIGLQAGGELIGVMTLNDDRVGGAELSAEDHVLLETLAAQLASSLLNLKLSARLRQAKEVETFQAVSTFFVHDLKNLASRLSLTMQNLPANFDNPEFREDALRVISTSLAKIDQMCTRLAQLRQGMELKLEQCDLTQLIGSTLDEFKVNLRAELKREFQPMPKTLVDSEQIHKVLTNLVMNANEAVNGNGVIQVRTLHEGNTVGFSVRDNGCGMSDEFIEKSLFRPFQTTKKKGLGIGLFHSKLIVEAHRGTFEVNSAIGVGTEFRVILPKTNGAVPRSNA